jgi:hypothetical protein
VLAPAALVVGFGIGSAGGNDPTPHTLATAGATPTVTVTRTVAAKDAPAAPPAATVTVTKTVTAKAPAPVAKPAPVTTAPAASIPGDGTFLIPADVKPGIYRASAPDSGNCYWARLKSTDGSLDSILANGNASGPVTVTIKKTDKAFETSGCSDFVRR